MAGFWYSGPFTESLLVGNLAVRLGRRVEWDSQGDAFAELPRGGQLHHQVLPRGLRLRVVMHAD